MNKNFVVPELLGRTANNLFQVAAAFGYAKKYGTDWFIPPHYHHRQIYKFWRFPIYKGNIRALKTYDRATDEGWRYEPIPFHEGGIKIRGFFQSWKHFDNVKDEFLAMLNFRHYPEYSEHTSIHIRLTDYVQNADSFPPINENYLLKAFDIIKPKKVLVFSDEIHKCKSMLATFTDIEFEFSPGWKEGGRNEYEQLSAMSSCKNNIIANSTFSWMGAFANRNQDKIVISPDASEWFGKKVKIDTSDLIPPAWTQVKFR